MKKQPEDFAPLEAARPLRQIQDDPDIATATEANALASASGPSNPAGDEPREPSSPVCYAKEFEDW